MALTKSCRVTTTLKNTGVDCDVIMGPTAMIVAVPRSFSFDDTDLADEITWFKTAVQAPASERVYPIFGNDAPIRFITNNKEADVIATLDDGLQVFIRYGFLNRVFATTNGGLCYAKALQSFLGSGYRVLEFDKSGHMLAHDNRDGTYTGLRCDFMFSPSPDLADFRNPWKTNFQVSFDPTEYVGNGVIFDGAFDLLDIGGLIDGEFTSVGPHTIAHLIVSLTTDCSDSDLVALLGVDLLDPTNFSVTNKATGAAVTITAVTNVGGNLQLAGTFVSGQTYIVVGASADILFGNNIEGYDFSVSAECIIP